MADALCGPSNPLQQFQKHTTADRTLQQDRLTSRFSPLQQGFRSHPGPNTGVLDAEYEAFNAGFAPGPSLGIGNIQSEGRANRLGAEPFSQFSQAAPDWAADFQRLHLSNASASLPHHGLLPQVSSERSTPGSWHQDFMQQHSQVQPQPQYLAESSSSQRYGGLRSDYPYTMDRPSMFGGANMSMADQATQSATQYQQPDPTFDEAAFERAFEQAASAAVEDRQQSDTVQQDHLDINLSQEVVPEAQPLDTLPEQMTQDLLQDHERIGADSIEDTRGTEADRSKADDADELARTAGALLDRVKDNQSEKFQQSSFLALMRQLRDKEVVVDGDGMVPESQARSSPGDFSSSQAQMDTTMTGAINSDDIVRERESITA